LLASQDFEFSGKIFSAALHIMSKAARSISRKKQCIDRANDFSRSQISRRIDAK